MHVGAVRQGTRVLLVDDLIATGGTALAGVALLRGQGAQVTQARFLVDLPDLGGAKRLEKAGVESDALLIFPGH
jgi:adenine phosphoribosyltransferase